MSTVEAYDPATDIWTTKANMPTPRTMSAIAVVDGRIYVIGGAFGTVQENRTLSAVEAYDPTTEKWTRKADMPTARCLSATCVIDGQIYVSGGVAKVSEISSCMPTVEVYDPSTDTWTQTFDMPRARSNHSASVVDGKMYIIGGADPELIKLIVEPYKDKGEPSTVDVYDPATGTWTTAADFPTPRGRHAADVVDG